MDSENEHLAKSEDRQPSIDEKIPIQIDQQDDDEQSIGNQSKTLSQTLTTANGVAITDDDLNIVQQSWDHVLSVQDKAVSFLATAMKEQPRLTAMFEKWNIDAVKQAQVIFDMWGSLIKEILVGGNCFLYFGVLFVVLCARRLIYGVIAICKKTCFYEMWMFVCLFVVFA